MRKIWRLSEIQTQVIKILRDSAEVSEDTEIRPQDLVSAFTECSTARVDLQLRVERVFELVRSFSVELELDQQSSVADLIHFAQVKVARSYGEDELLKIIKICFQRNGSGHTDQQVALLDQVNNPLSSALGELDGTDWDEWRREVQMFLPIQIEEGLIRETSTELRYFLGSEIELLRVGRSARVEVVSDTL